MSEPCFKCGAGRVSCAHREYHEEAREREIPVYDRTAPTKQFFGKRPVAKHGYKFK